MILAVLLVVVALPAFAYGVHRLDRWSTNIARPEFVSQGQAVAR